MRRKVSKFWLEEIGEGEDPPPFLSSPHPPYIDAFYLASKMRVPEKISKLFKGERREVGSSIIDTRTVKGGELPFTGMMSSGKAGRVRNGKEVTAENYTRQRLIFQIFRIPKTINFTVPFVRNLFADRRLLPLSSLFCPFFFFFLSVKSFLYFIRPSLSYSLK